MIAVIATHGRGWFGTKITRRVVKLITLVRISDEIASFRETRGQNGTMYLESEKMRKWFQSVGGGLAVVTKQS